MILFLLTKHLIAIIKEKFFDSEFEKFIYYIFKFQNPIYSKKYIIKHNL